MRGMIAALLISPTLVVPLLVTPSLIVPSLPAPSLVGWATAAEPVRPRNVLLFVASGLRPAMVNEQTAPAMAALLKHGVTFTNTHSVFPTLALPNAAALATGHLPADTGVFGNTIYAGFGLPSTGNSAISFLGDNRVLGEIDDHFAGNATNEDTILHAAAVAGLSAAFVGALGPSLLFDHTARTGLQTVIVDDQTGHPGGTPLSPEMQAAFQEFSVAPEAPSRGNGNAGGTPEVNVARHAWFADVATLTVLPTFKERHKPFVMVFWARALGDAQNDQSDAPLRLIPGINGPASLTGIKNADNDLAQLLTALKELGLESTTDVILTSDHGTSTISKESATSYAAKRSYKDVPPALLPPGFVAIDLAHALRMNLFDPDAIGDAKNTPVPAGNFPVRGNGLIGDDAAHPEVMVVANGGSDLIYVPSSDKLMAARIVQILAAQDYVSGLFVASRLGSIAGTLPLSAVELEGSALMPTPAIVVNFRTFTTGCADQTACGVNVADSVSQQGQGAGGSFGIADTRTVMGMAGPGFRAGFQDAAPVSTADIGRTVAALLGVKLKDKGKLIGRVLTEAMLNGAPVSAKSNVLKSVSDDAGRVTELKYQTVGTTHYFEAAGYHGRTLGLD